MGFRGGGGGSRGRFSGPGNKNRFEMTGPPAEILALGEVSHPCEGELVCKALIDKVPYFNAPIYLENKSLIGKIDEILGPINEYLFTIKPAEGILATSFKPSQKVFIGSDKLLPLERFLPKPKTQTAAAAGIKRKASSSTRGGARGRGSSIRGNARGGAFRGRGGAFSKRGNFRGGSSYNSSNVRGKF